MIDPPEGEDRDIPHSVTRRDFLMYGGGATVLAWAGIGAGWFTFVYERTGPEEDVVREYVDAVDRSQFYTVNQLFHEDAPHEPPTPADIPDVDGIDIEVEKTEVIDREADPETASIEELALVRAELRLRSPQESQRLTADFWVARDTTGEWKLWADELG